MSKRKPGRPPFKFDSESIEKMKSLARCHCPDNEIAAFMGCSEAGLKKRFRELLHEEREAGKANLRAKQFKMAMDGNVTMLIWLGKQILNQKEKAEVDSAVAAHFTVINRLDGSKTVLQTKIVDPLTIGSGNSDIET